MDRKDITILLIKIFPLFFVVLLLWQFAGISRFYHAVVAYPLDLLCPLFDPNGPVKGVELREDEFFIKLLIVGKKLPLFLKAEDITSNMAVLLTLYLVSPIKPRTRKFLTFLSISIFILYLIHICTVMASLRLALMTHPSAVNEFPPGSSTQTFLPLYYNFYIQFGMYLFPACLWLPYILGFFIQKKEPDNISKNKIPATPRVTGIIQPGDDGV